MWWEDRYKHASVIRHMMKVSVQSCTGEKPNSPTSKWRLQQLHSHTHRSLNQRGEILFESLSSSLGRLPMYQLLINQSLTILEEVKSLVTVRWPPYQSGTFQVFPWFGTPRSVHKAERCLLRAPLRHGQPAIFPGCPPPPTGCSLHLHSSVQYGWWPGQAHTHHISPWWPHRGVPPTNYRDRVENDAALILQHAHYGS